MRFRERPRPETMGTGSPIDAWRFLLGTWRGASQGQFGETGIVESEATFTGDLGDRFLVATGEATCEGRLLNRSLQVLFYDTAAGRFRRKTFFSYGFVNNEVEYARTEDEIRFEIEAEPRPKQFQGIRWRSFVRKISDREIAMGLEASKDGAPFEGYGEVILRKVE